MTGFNTFIKYLLLVIHILLLFIIIPFIIFIIVVNIMMGCGNNILLCSSSYYLVLPIGLSVIWFLILDNLIIKYTKIQWKRYNNYLLKFVFIILILIYTITYFNKNILYGILIFTILLVALWLKKEFSRPLNINKK